MYSGGGWVKNDALYIVDDKKYPKKYKNVRIWFLFSINWLNLFPFDIDI